MSVSCLSGYISSPRQTRLGGRTYERLAMLASTHKNIYVELELVAKEYLDRCKSGAWKKENMDKVLKYWNLERIIEAELFGQSLPEQLTMDDLVGEGNDSAQDDVIKIED